MRWSACLGLILCSVVAGCVPGFNGDQQGSGGDSGPGMDSATPVPDTGGGGSVADTAQTDAMLPDAAPADSSDSAATFPDGATGLPDGSADARGADATGTNGDAAPDTGATTVSEASTDAAAVTCAVNNGGCDPHASCTSPDGGVACTCNIGYSGNGTSCAAVDSCKTSNGGCDTNATCTSTGPGTNTCTCNTGYTGSGAICTGVGSCAVNNGGCAATAKCTATTVGTTCACNTGYSGNGTTCTAVNSCTTSNGGCDTNATCTSTGPGTNTCACKTGYSGTGTTCTAVNSCATNNGGCTGGQTCTSTGPGTNTCACGTGTIACTGSCPTSGVSCIKVTQIAAGWGHACALLSTGTVECWGRNSEAQLGKGSAGSNSPYPVVVAGLTNATAIAAGGNHSCALAGSSWECWGDNNIGEIGAIGSAICDGQPCTLTPTRVVSSASALSTGYSNTCAVVSGQVECLGDSSMAVIGSTYGPDSCSGGTNNCAQSAQSIESPLLAGVTAVSSDNTAACAIVSGGEVVCWGEEGTGEIGPNGTSITCSGNDLCSSPVQIPGITNAVSLAGGQWFLCALTSDHTVECWGSNEYGQLGSTETATCEGFPYACSETPSVVSNLSGVTQIAAGDDFACALLQNGTVQCWGNNAYDELGNASVTGSCQGQYNTCSSSPVSVSGVSGATAITAGGNFGCALTQSGQVLCWGFNSFDQLGNGTSVNSLTAVPVQF